MSKFLIPLLTCIENALMPVSDYTGRIISWLFLPLIIITFAVVVLRYGFNFGNIWIQEIAIYLHAIILMSCMGYTLHCDKHVRVDIFYNNISEGKRAWVNLLGNIFLLIPVSIVIILVSFGYAQHSWLLMEKSLEAGGLPLVFVLKSLIPLMALFLLIQGIADIAHELRFLINHSNHQD